MTTATINNKAYTFIGMTGDVTECGCCGRSESRLVLDKAETATSTSKLRVARKQARADGWEKCQSCHGRGNIRLWWGALAQTIGCDDCAGLGYTEPLPPWTNEQIRKALAEGV